MVDLPSIPEAIPQLRAPTSRLSGADIAAPFAALAANLDKAGEIVDKDIAQPLAEKAGREAVTTGPDGQPVIQKMPIFGAASAAYMRAAKMTALAQMQPEIENKLTEMKVKFPNDPTGYKTAAADFTKTYVGNLSDEDLKQSAFKIANAHAGENYRSLVVSFDHTNVQNALVGLQSRLSDINERGASIARQGGASTPEYQQLHGDRAAIYKELAADPRFKFPQERVDQELKANRDEDVVQSVVGDVQRQFKTRKNLPEAQRALQDAFWGKGSENLNLSVTQRDKGVSEGLKTLERLSVEDKVATSAFQSATGEYVKNLQHAPDMWNEGRHNDMLQRARDLGDYKSIAQLDVAKHFVPLWGAIKALPPDQASRVLTDISRGVVPAIPITLQDRALQAKIEAAADKAGVPRNLAVNIAQIESGANPGAVAPSGRYKGLYQLSDEEFAARGGAGNIFDADQNIGAGLASIKAKSDAFAAQFGRAPSATEVYLMHQQGEAGLRAHIANPDAPAWQNMASTGEGKQKGEAWAKLAIWGNLPQFAKDQFGSVENVSSRDFVNIWAQRVQGVPFAATGLQPGQSGTAIRNPYAYKMWEDTVKATREQLGKNADHLSEQIIKQATDGNPIPPETLATFVTSVSSSGKDELLNKVRPALAALDARMGVREGGPSAIAALDSHIRAVKASGVDPVKYETLTRLQQGAAQDAETWRKDPLSMGVTTRLVDPVDPINTNDPAAAAAELGKRDAKLKILQGSGRGIGPAPAVIGAEGDSIKTALVQGDPGKAGALLTGMAQTLSPENYRATLASDPMKEALSGMIRSRDPARMTAGFSALDKYWQSDPWGFKGTFGEGTLNHLQAWQGLKDSFTAPEIAERLNRADDPSVVKGRDDLRDMARDEMKSWQPSDVAYQIGTGWWGTGRVTGSTPSVPDASFQQGAIMQRELLHDFSDTYTALRTYGVDPDRAKDLAAKRVRSEWGPSPTANNQVMKYPPETYYPKVDGSQGWLRQSLEDTVTAIKGPQVAPMTGGDIAGTTMPRANWTIKGLIADNLTQADIAAGRPPRYQIAIDTGQGLTELVRDPASGTDHWRFDPAPARAAGERRYYEGEARARAAQATTEFTSGMPLP